MRVRVLGSGCKKCNDLYDSAVQAAARFPDAGHSIEKVDDVDVFFQLGVTRTPALVIDDEVVSSGNALSVDEIAALMQERASE